jgi:hypothetical protein
MMTAADMMIITCCFAGSGAWLTPGSHVHMFMRR